MTRDTQGLWLAAVGALLGCTAVALGAFGAHALGDRLSAEQRGWYDTAAFYLLVHAVAVVACSALTARLGRSCVLAGGLISAGVVVFSATLFAMALGGPRLLGAVTPVGGSLLLGGWLTLAWAAWRARRAR